MDFAIRDSLATQLRALGVGPGGVVLMHSSFKSLGFVVGGPQAVVQAVLDARGPDGTSSCRPTPPDNSDPASWSRPPVPEDWWEPIRHEAPGFDPARTPASKWMGALAETVRTWPGARRSAHPQVSFAAVGPRAAEIVEPHRLDDSLGDESPLGAVYRLDGQVLLLGCGHDTNTSLHLAECRQPTRRGTPERVHPARRRHRSWVNWEEVEEDESDFEARSAPTSRRPARPRSARSAGGRPA